MHATALLRQAFGPRLKQIHALERVPPTALTDRSPNQLAILSKPPCYETFIEATALFEGEKWPFSLSLASPTSWQQYLQVNPALAATWPGGTVNIADANQPIVWSGRDRAAYLCAHHFETSLLLAPNLLSAERLPALTERLTTLTAFVLGAEAATAQSPIEQMALLQDELNRQLDRLPDNTWPTYFHHAPAEAPLPDLHAIFKTELERVVLVFDKLTGAQIREMDWAALAAGVGGDCTGLQLVTVDQLQLLLAQELPLDVVFRRFLLDWGHDPITAVQPHPHFIMRHAARLPLHILLNLLPPACLAATDEEDWYQIIHDFQNKLLNVQLEHEIMVRLKLVDRFVPSTVLPEREAKTAVRVNAIFSQLHNWAQFYIDQMAQVASS